MRTFYQRELQKTNQTEFGIEKVTKEKVTNCISNGKIIIICLRAEQSKTISLYEVSFYPEIDNCRRNKVKVELDLSNYTIKCEVRKAAGVDKSKFLRKADLSCSKSDVDKLDVDKIKSVPNYLSK